MNATKIEIKEKCEELLSLLEDEKKSKFQSIRNTREKETLKTGCIFRRVLTACQISVTNRIFSW